MDEIRHNLNGKLPESSPLKNLLCLRCALPLLKPLQTSCGCRICRDCYERLCNGVEYHVSGIGGYKCNRCLETFHLEDKDTVFKDTAAENEIRSTQPLFPCYHEGCHWRGTNIQYRNHVSFCQFARVACPNEGCNVKVVKDEQEGHVAKCPARPIRCSSCKEVVPSNKYAEHLFKNCTEFKMPCPFCSISKPRKELDEHCQLCPWEIRCCNFQKYGCTFKGTYFQLQTHKEKHHPYRTRSKQQAPLLGNTGTLSQHGDTFIWKIPEISRHVRQEKKGETVSLYSSPFYTSRPGHKMCLRVYFNGVGPGKGTHISLFFYIMKGENDDHLTWPYLPKSILLSLVDNTNAKVDISIFKPSFAKPTKIMGRGSGIPKFAPKSILQNPQYIHNDTLTIAYTIDGATGLPTSFQSPVGISPHFNPRPLPEQGDAHLNGMLLWKINEFPKKQQDAIEGKLPFLDSPLFYTSSHGYKMCVRVYLNGDGSGKGTHLSVFFVLMKGPHDSLLPWPFKQKVTVQLTNQSLGKAHYVYQFTPDPSGRLFQRPEQEMNVASGCPMFCRLEGLVRDGFVKDDMLYLIAIVDTNGL